MPIIQTFSVFWTINVVYTCAQVDKLLVLRLEHPGMYVCSALRCCREKAVWHQFMQPVLWLVRPHHFWSLCESAH
jgi:hypothetical protein